MMRRLIQCAALLAAVWCTSGSAQAEDTLYPTALFSFQERGPAVEGMGSQVADLLFANLVVRPEMYLVDREDMAKILQEQELNVSGLVNTAEATQVGQLTGAKILVTGSVLQVGEKLYLVAKVIGTETSRVAGASVKGGARDGIDALAQQLAEKIATTVSEKADELVAKPVSREERIAKLQKQLGEAERPTLKISIDERHVGQLTIDPAAETEMTLLAKELGFEVVDPQAGDSRDADVFLTGEGFSEFTARQGNLAPVKARLEVKAVDADSGRVLAVDRQTSVAVDLNEQIAGKTALQEASAKIAERLLPKLVEANEGK